MNKALSVATIVLPLVMFLAIYGQRIVDNFIDNKNDQIDAETQLLEALVGGSGWTDPGSWGVE